MIDDEVLALDGYVAHCAITPELAGQIVCLARLRPGDSDVVDTTLRSFGWSDDDVPIDDARFGTPQGHAVWGDDDPIAIPFAYFSYVGGELMPEDLWGGLPGWSSRACDEEESLDPLADEVIGQFTTLLSRGPDCEVRTAEEPGRRRGVAWRIGEKLLVVGRGKGPLFYHQVEHVQVCIGAYPHDRPLPVDLDGIHPFL